MTHPTEVKLPESLEVVAWLYHGGPSDGDHARLPKVRIHEPSGSWPICDALVRLSDAESALKARDAEIERLRGALERSQRAHVIAGAERDQSNDDAERYQWLREQCIKRDGLTIAKCGGWNGLEPWSGDDPDAAIDQARAEGGEKTK